MNFKNILKPAVTSTLVLLVVCGLIYPLVMNGLGAVLFPYQSKGSIIEIDGQKVGSEHIGQEFTEDYFMKGRPSAVNYNTYKEDEEGNQTYNDGTPFGGVSSGSKNYAPSNPALKERVEKDMEAILEADPDLKREDIPSDLVTASGSGLDPHISPEAAAIQLPGISEASGISIEDLEKIVENNTDGKLLGIWGNDTVNVLGVNIEIARAMGLI